MTAGVDNPGLLFFRTFGMVVCMEGHMQRKIIVFVAPPGAGKGTQAEKLEEQFGFFHLESSKVIEDMIREGLAHDPNDPIFLRELELNKSGALNTPELVKQWIATAIKKAATAGQSIVFSGSPRTLEEAQELVPLLEELYGKENIVVMRIVLTEDESVRRNLLRRICEAHRHPIDNPNAIVCPIDGSPLLKRDVDSTEEKIRFRYRTYLERTAPVLQYFTEHGYAVEQISGDDTRDNVHGSILAAMERH